MVLRLKNLSLVLDHYRMNTTATNKFGAKTRKDGYGMTEEQTTWLP